MRGPGSSVVELPMTLAWSGLRVCDPADERQLGLLYETVIRVAMDGSDLDRYLNAGLLRWLWSGGCRRGSGRVGVAVPGAGSGPV